MPAADESVSDSDLMQRLCAQAGPAETDALFDEIFRRYHRRIVAWCFSLTRDRETAADLAQEVLLKAYRYRHSWRGDARLSTWLYAIARNHCLTAIRKRASGGVGTEAILSPRIRDRAAVPPDVAAERRQLYAFAGRLMTRSLEPLEVRIMALHYGFGVPLGEITESLGLRNPSGAKAYIVNARRKLTVKLQRRGANIHKAA